jgi:hypothetical protein
MIDQLMKAVPVSSIIQQSEWLHKWGIDELVSEGNRYWEEHKSAPQVSALKMRSRKNESQALTSRDGLGAFSVLELTYPIA